MRTCLVLLAFYICIIFLFNHVSAETIVFSSVSSNYTEGSCGVQCGYTEECACFTLQSALDSIPTNFTGEYKIMVLPGVYTGVGNVNITMDTMSNISFQSTNGPLPTTISCERGESSFIMNNSSASITGFSMDDCMMSILSGSRPVFTDIIIQESSNISYPGAVVIVGDNCDVQFQFVSFIGLVTKFNSPLYVSESSNLTVSNSLFQDNDCTSCITVTNQKHIDSKSSVTIEDSIFMGNSGILNTIYILYSGVTINNCTFEDNSAGRIVTATDCSLAISNSTWNSNRGTAVDISGTDELSCILSFSDSDVINGTSTERASSGVYIDRCFVQVSNCNFISNFGATGSALYLKSPINSTLGEQSSITNSYFDSNIAQSNLQLYGGDGDIISSGSGGAIYISGTHSYDIIIQENNFTNNAAPKGTGGAIHTRDQGESHNATSLYLVNNNFDNNQAVSGGALYSSFRVTVSNCNFTSNMADKHGGAACLTQGTSDILMSNFNFNVANNFGGAVYFTDSNGTISDSNFYFNIGLNGGGTFVQQNTSVQIRDCTYFNNTAIVMGGAISIQDDIVKTIPSEENYSARSSFYDYSIDPEHWLETHRIPIIVNTKIIQNHAIKGGGVAISTEATPGIFYSCIEGNNATFGGGIYLDDQSGTTLYNTSIQNNIAYYGAGIVIYGTSSALFENLDIYNNSAKFNGGGALIGGNSSPLFRNSTISNNYGASQSGGADISGSSTAYFKECIFSNNTSPRAGGFYTAQSSSPTFDLCTFEYNRVTNFGAGAMLTDNSTPNLNNCTLRHNHADGEGGALTIIGSAVPSIIGCLFENNIGYHGGGMDVNTDTSFNVTLCRFINNIAKTRGGAIRLSGSSAPNFFATLFKQNYAVNGAGVAIYDDSSPTFHEVVFLRNLALVQGGGILSGDWSFPQFVNCKFIENTVTTGTGGGIAISDFSVPSFNGSQITSNQAPHGAGVYTISGGHQPVFYNCTIENNRASIDGGGFAIHGVSYLYIESSVIQSNSAFGYGAGINSEDQSNPHVSNTLFKQNFAFRSGGGYSIQGRSEPLLSGCIFSNNFAIRGGGIFVAPQARGNVTFSEFNQNLSIFGAGIYVGAFSNFNAELLVVENNFATYCGGGIAMESTTNSAFNASVVSNNKAISGGGLYVFPVYNSLPSSPQEYSIYDDTWEDIFREMRYSPFFIEHADTITQVQLKYKEIIEQGYNLDIGLRETTIVDVDVPILPHIGKTFSNTEITTNIAFLGGGVAIYDAVGSNPITFDHSCYIVTNRALEYGGGMYFSAFQNNQTYLYGTTVSNNTADYGGGSVAWISLSKDQTGNEDDFCSNCVFTDNSAGYQNGEGFATPPVNTSFTETASCPGKLSLDGESFQVGVMLQDHFGTLVKGKILEDTMYNVTVLCAEASCLLEPSNIDGRIPPEGNIVFSELQLSGKSEASCTLVFSTTQLSGTFDNLPVPDFQALSCNITLSGCPSGEVVYTGTNYDSCTEANFWETNRIYVLFFVITALVMSLLLLIALQITLWYKKKRRISWGKNLNVPDFEEGKPSITLEDILNDPNIPTIPWEQIEVGKKIGVGAAAIVRQGLWLSNGKGIAVALKQLLLPTQQITSDILKDFLIEIKLTSALYHDHVVRLIGVSCSPDLELHLVTELMERGSIRDVLDAKGKNLRWDIRLKLLCDAAKGMSYLHSRNVIHRDLKPRNLLVTRDWMCKVADFGASTIQVQANKTMTVIGTPAYMAPEVLAHTKYSEKADVYSFGIIIVEVYTGEPPYTGPEFEDIRNQIQLISRIINDNLHPDTSKLPPALEHLVLDCWNEEPALRPSFSEIIIRLRRLGKLEMKNIKEEEEKEEKDDDNDETDKDLIELDIKQKGEDDIPIITPPSFSDTSLDGNMSSSPAAELKKDDPNLHPTTIQSQILLLDGTEQSKLDKEALVRANSLANLVNVKKKRNTMSETTPLLSKDRSSLYKSADLTTTSIN